MVLLSTWSTWCTVSIDAISVTYGFAISIIRQTPKNCKKTNISFLQLPFQADGNRDFIYFSETRILLVCHSVVCLVVP